MPASFGPPWIPNSLVPSNPAAGQPYNLVVPAGFYYHLIGATMQLVTGAAVANRMFFAEVFDTAGHAAFYSQEVTNQTASQTVTYTFGLNFSSGLAIVANNGTLTLPDVVMPEGWKMQFSANNIAVADQIQNIVIIYESLAYV